MFKTLVKLSIILHVGLSCGLAGAQTPSTVNIKSIDGPLWADGQGIIIDAAGIIVTNKHIIGPSPQHIYVTLADGKTFKAKVVRYSSKDDMCFIKIDADVPLKAVTLGDSSQMEIGNTVYAFENRLVNADRKSQGKVLQIYREAATDTAAIVEVNILLKPGDSGGPILDKDGMLLGLIMANKKNDASKSFAIVSNKIKEEYLSFRNSILN